MDEVKKPEVPSDPVPNTTAIAQTPAPVMPASPVASESEETKPGGKWWVGPLIALLLIAIAGGYFALIGHGSTKQPAITKHDIEQLRISLSNSISDTYPDNANEITQNDINGQSFEGLTRYANKTHVVPNLALSWTNPDTSTWVFKLRQDVTFHTGKHMMASDVKASIDSLAGKDFGDSFASTIKTVEVVDNYTVKITTDGPDVLLPNELTFLWVYDTTSGKKDDTVNGSGPFVAKPGITNTDTDLQLVAYDKYWGGRPSVRAVRYTVNDNDAKALAALKAKTVDIANIYTAKTLTELDPQAFTTVHQNSNDGALFELNSIKKGSPFTNLNVRKAVSLALDRQALITAKGVSANPSGQVLPKTVTGYDSSISIPTQNIDQAKQLIVAAGYPKGFTVIFSYLGSLVGIPTETQKQLAAVGITVKLDPQPDVKAIQARVASKVPDMFFVSAGTDLIDGSDIFGTIASLGFFQNDTYDTLSTQASQTFDAAKRLSILQQISRTIVDNQLVVPLFNGADNYWATPKNLHIEQDSFSGFGVPLWKAYTE